MTIADVVNADFPEQMASGHLPAGRERMSPSIRPKIRIYFTPRTDRLKQMR